MRRDSDGHDPLFLRDAYLRQMDATVTTIHGGRVAQYRTVFSVTGGDQPHDSGTVDGRRVIDGTTLGCSHDRSTFDGGDLRMVKTDSTGTGQQPATRQGVRFTASARV